MRNSILALGLALVTMGCASQAHSGTQEPTASGSTQVASVNAVVETDPVPNSNDAADDPAIWVHPSDPAKSLIIGADKLGGIATYSLDGKQVEYRPDGLINNVDLRYNFLLGGKRVTVLAAGNRANNTIAVWKMNAETRLEPVAKGKGIPTLLAGEGVYGSCLYSSPVSGRLYFFANDKKGNVKQFELYDDAGQVNGRLVRSLKLGSQVEGCVADDELGHFYIGEEAVGVWKFNAEPNGGTERPPSPIISVGRNNVAKDVEGLAIYYGPDKKGYLLVSSQGNNTYAVFERAGNNAYVMSFRVAAGAIDGTSDTDGIDVTNMNLGGPFSQGVFVAQDGDNKPANQNFKLVPWESIANGANPKLMVDASFDVRKIGLGKLDKKPE